MLRRGRQGIKPYGYDWNGDRSAPDYDPQRDPWLPGSLAYGQYPRRPWLREALREPIWWALGAWFTVTFGTVGLYGLGVFSHDTVFVVWVAKYLALFGGLAVAGVWSLVAWLRRTPRGERGPAFRRALKRAPGFIGLLLGGTAFCVALEAIEKRYGVPFLVSLVVAFAVALGVVRWWQSRHSAG
jgi:hypothetical protein